MNMRAAARVGGLLLSGMVLIVGSASLLHWIVLPEPWVSIYVAMASGALGYFVCRDP